MRTIAIVAQKGGSCKTTSVVNMAACLAGQGRKVLVIDTDTQANATFVLLKGGKPRRPTLSEVLTGDATATEAIVPSAFDRIEIIPAEPDLADITVALATEVGRERRLRVALAEVSSQSFDVCLIDTGPTRSLLTTNVLNFVREVLIPIGPGLFGFLGLGQLQADMNLVRRFLENKELRLAGIFLVLVEKNNVNRDFEREIRGMFGDLVLEATIPRSIKFEESNARQLPIFDHAPKSAGARAYEALTLEAMSRGDGHQEDRLDPARGDLPEHDAA
jgi:chromosome partitioning protein